MNLSLSCCQSFFNYTGRIQWATLQYATLPLINNILKAICVYPLSPLYNTQEKFQLQNDKNERKWVEHGFQNDKIDLWSCFVPLISKYSTVMHNIFTLFFKMDEKAYFYQKFHLYFFRALFPNWEHYVQHFFGEFRYCTLGATGVCHSDPSRSIFKIFPSSDFNRIFRWFTQ